MTDYPDDVMQAARAALAPFGSYPTTAGALFCEPRVAAVESAVASAIMAERERCARIADHYGSEVRTFGNLDADPFKAARAACVDVAAAILAGASQEDAG